MKFKSQIKSFSSTNQALFSMAGDGETVVDIGSVFLATVEANQVLAQFLVDHQLPVVLSGQEINVTELFAEEAARLQVNFWEFEIKIFLKNETY